MRCCLTFFFVLVCAPVAPAAVLLGPTVNPANGHRYYLLGASNWTASEAEAVTLGGHLVTVSDAAENDWVFDTFMATAGTTEVALWTGFNDATVEGAFSWVSGEPVTYTRFSPGEPNNDAVHGGEDFVGILPDYRSVLAREWNDLNNTASGLSAYGVVEVVPEPTAIALAVPTAMLVLARTPRRARRQRVGPSPR